MQLEDERDIEKIRIAIVKAFQNNNQKVNDKKMLDGEEIIDTTTQDFKETFKGFSNTPAIKQKRNAIQQNTQILRG